MDTLNKNLTNPVERPVKVVQFGEGNFLRGFVDYMIDIANEKDYSTEASFLSNLSSSVILKTSTNRTASILSPYVAE